MPTIIRSGGGGVDISTANATKAQVLEGKTFYSNQSDDIQTGTMTNHGAVTNSVNVGGTYKGSAGYYSSITVTGPTFSESTGNAGDVLSGKKFYSNTGEVVSGTMTNKGAATINVGETGGAGYYSSISINKSSLGTAKAEHVLNTVTFTNNNGSTQSGTMVDRGSINTSLSYGGNISGSAGYYSSINVTAQALTGNATSSQVLSGYTFLNQNGSQTGSLSFSGNATAAQVLKNQTFYSSSTSKLTGTMNNWGNKSQTITAGGSITLCTGYYTTTKITAGSGAASQVYSDNSVTIKASWSCLNLGFYATAYAVAFNDGNWGTSSRYPIKCYTNGMWLNWCHSGSGTYEDMGMIVAYA